MPKTIGADAVDPKPWNSMQIMEALTEKFRCLDINERATSSHEQNALIPYKRKNQKYKITQGDGAIIPYEGFDPIRKRLPRPKVDLDAEKPTWLEGKYLLHISPRRVASGDMSRIAC